MDILYGYGYFCHVSGICTIRNTGCVLLPQCFSATHLADFLYCLSAMATPKMFCKFPSTTSATFVRHYTRNTKIFAFSRTQIDLVAHHKI